MSEDSNEKKPFVNDSDPTLILVRGSFETKQESKNHVRGVSNAIKSVLAKHGEAKLRCIGAASVNNAVKAVTVVRNEYKDTKNIVMESDFVSIKNENSEETTSALVINVYFSDEL